MFLIAAAFIAPFALGSAAQKAESTPLATVWTEPYGFDFITRRLNVERVNLEKSAALKLKITSLETKGTWTTTREDCSSEGFTDWRLAVPIAVVGEVRPQVLAKLYRPNWLDFKIYSYDGDGIQCSFSISCRDEEAIKWNVAKGRLTNFETFDRFERPPSALRQKEKPPRRYQLHEWYRFDRKTSKWIRYKKRWETYVFGASPGGQKIESPRDCKFLYHGA